MQSSADRTGCAVDQDFLPALDFSLFETLQRCHSRAWDSSSLLVGEIGWFDRDHPVFEQAFIFGMTAEIDGEGGGENWVARLEASHLLANRFNFASQFHSQNGTLGTAP